MSYKGSSRCARTQSWWQLLSKVFERWATAAWTSGSGAVECMAEGAAGDEGFNWGLEEARVRQDEIRRQNRIVKPGQIEHEGGGGQSGVFRGGAGAADVVNPLRAAAR